MRRLFAPVLLQRIVNTGSGGNHDREKIVRGTQRDPGKAPGEGIPGDGQAQENLGYCYYYGRDMPVDYEKAFHYFALGAFDGHIRSLYKIGDMYRNGYYIPQNEAEAFCIYRRCEETMTEAALLLVGADVMMRLGDCYFSGIGTQVDDKKALEYYQKAERLFFTRLEQGDFLIRNCYDRVIKRQAETRKRLQATLPSYEWVEM